MTTPHDSFLWMGVIPDAAVIADRDGQIVVANEHAARLFGYSVDTLLTMRVDQLIPETIRPVHQAHRARYNTSPRPRPMAPDRVLSALRADGTIVNVEIALGPVGDGLTVAVVRDTSTRYLQERAAGDRRIMELQSEVIDLLRERVRS